MSKHNQKNKHESSSSNESEISIHDVEVMAYQLHQEKGGSDLENWLEAERLLREKH